MVPIVEYRKSVYEFIKYRIDYHLKIGLHFMFGPNVKLWDTKNHPFNPLKRHAQCEYIAHHGLSIAIRLLWDDIIIGNDVRVGMDCNILREITIGNGSVVATGCFITKNSS